MSPLPPSAPPSRVPLYIVAVVVVVGLVFCLARCAGATGIQLPLNQYCADSLTAGVYSGVRVGRCPVAPPPPPVGACAGPAGLTRLVTSDISYGYAPAIRRYVDVREWSGIWGHWSATDAVQPWPGFAVAGTVSTLRQFGRYNFVAAHFNTGTNGGTVRGNYVFPSNFAGPNIDMSVSKTCGDFSPNVANPACLATNMVSADSFFIYWNFSGGSPSFECQMQPNTDYYTNIRLTDPNSAMECAVGNPICPITTSMQANH